MELNQALSDTADEFGVYGEDREYFKYLMMQELNKLGEDEEMSEEAVAEVAKKVKSRSAPTTTSVDDPTPAPGNEPGGIGLEQFEAMGIMERSKLYGKDPKLYNSLMEQEKAARMKK